MKKAHLYQIILIKIGNHFIMINKKTIKLKNKLNNPNNPNNNNNYNNNIKNNKQKKTLNILRKLTN